MPGLAWRRQWAALSAPTLPSPLCRRTPLPVGGPIVAVVGEEVKVQLPEDVQGDAAIGRRHVVIGLPEHGIKAVQGHVLTQQPVCEPVDLQQPFQLLPRERSMAASAFHTPYTHVLLYCADSFQAGESPSDDLLTADMKTRAPRVTCDNIPFF